MICKMCKKDYNKIGAKGLCYVCSTKEPHREKIESILKEGFWSIEEIDTIIDEAIEEVKPTSPSMMGLVMKTVSPKVKGKADMKEVSSKIKEKLAKL